MTRRRFAMPCSFSYRKTARRYGFQGLLDLRSLAHRFHGLAAYDSNCHVKNNPCQVRLMFYQTASKGGYQQTKQDELQTPGYYWLAYDWENLLLSCTLCNQQFKKNLFPLLNPETRAHSHHDDIGLEQPLLINPSITNPKQYIGFRQEIPYAIDGNIYGKTSIKCFGLNRSELEEERRTHLAQFKKLFDILNISKERTNDPEWQAITNNIRQTLEEASAPDKPYSSMMSNILHS